MGIRLRTRRARLLVPLLLVTGLLVSAPIGTAQSAAPAVPTTAKASKPRFTTAAGFDVSAPMRDVARQATAARRGAGTLDRPERGPAAAGQGFSGDAAVQSTTGRSPATIDIPSPSVNFEGIPAEANIPILGGLPIPPDPDGDVGPNHYVEMVNTAWAVYSKTGTLLLGPLSLASIWAGFEVPDCEDNSGDPIVVHDQQANRWILTQFTTLGPNYYNCVAISTGPNPTGSYYRYAFSTGVNFPDYPKYGVWRNTYVATTREFAPDDSFAGIGVYGLERARMLNGNPAARAVSVLVGPATGAPEYLTGDGWLPSDWDGTRRPPAGSPNYIVGTQDDEGPYGAPFDAINIFKFFVSFGPSPSATLVGPTTIPVAEFDSDFPCVPPGSRNCIPQPGTSQTDRHPLLPAAADLAAGLPQLRHARVAGDQPVGRGAAGHRRHALVRAAAARRPADPLPAGHLRAGRRRAPLDGQHRPGQEGQHGPRLQRVQRDQRVPRDPLHRPAQGDPAHTLPQGEAVIINGGGSQTDDGARWGDYTSMNIDPGDDCTLLVRQPVLRHHLRPRLEHPHRRLPHARLHRLTRTACAGG